MTLTPVSGITCISCLRHLFICGEGHMRYSAYVESEDSLGEYRATRIGTWESSASCQTQRQAPFTCIAVSLTPEFHFESQFDFSYAGD